MTFKDKRIVLTGAAGAIGEALAKQLASEGARLALADLNSADLEAVAEACRGLGGEALAIPTDLTNQNPPPDTGRRSRPPVPGSMLSYEYLISIFIMLTHYW